MSVQQFLQLKQKLIQVIFYHKTGERPKGFKPMSTRLEVRHSTKREPQAVNRYHDLSAETEFCVRQCNLFTLVQFMHKSLANVYIRKLEK